MVHESDLLLDLLYRTHPLTLRAQDGILNGDAIIVDSHRFSITNGLLLNIGLWSDATGKLLFSTPPKRSNP